MFISIPLMLFQIILIIVVWPDAYYLTANKGGANKVYAIERDVILAGDPNPQIIGFPLPGNTANPNTVLSPEPANLTGVDYPEDLPGYIVYLQDDGWGGIPMII